MFFCPNRFGVTHLPSNKLSGWYVSCVYVRSAFTDVDGSFLYDWFICIEIEFDVVAFTISEY
jgi:hypothetical protein